MVVSEITKVEVVSRERVLAQGAILILFLQLARSERISISFVCKDLFSSLALEIPHEIRERLTLVVVVESVEGAGDLGGRPQVLALGEGHSHDRHKLNSQLIHSHLFRSSNLYNYN